MERKSGWTGDQLVLETSFWDSGEESEGQSEEVRLNRNRKAVKEENYVEGGEIEDTEDDSETELDSDDEGIGSMNSAGQNEAPGKGFVISGTMGRRRDFDRDHKGRSLGRHSVGGMLTHLKKSLQSKGKTGGEVFGLPLAQLLQQEGGQVPNIVRWATGLIEARGSEAWEGIYRLSGQATTVAALKNSIKCGRKPKPSDAESIHSVAALLKVG